MAATSADALADAIERATGIPALATGDVKVEESDHGGKTFGGDIFGGEGEEGAEVVGVAVVSDGESVVAEQPGDGSFDHPTVFAEFLAGLDAFAGQKVLDGRKPFAVVPGVKVCGQAELFPVVQTIYLLAFFLRPGDGRQEQRGQDGDDRDHHQQLDERKGPANPAHGAASGPGTFVFHKLPYSIR